MTKRALIIGGTGQIGRAVAVELLDRGWRVTLAARGGRGRPEALLRRGATLIPLDRDQPDALSEAIGGGADAVIDTIAFTDVHARQLLALQEDVGAFVVISSSSVYHDGQGRTLDEAHETGFPQFTGPIAETQPTVAPGPDTYSTRKVAVERTLLDQAKCPVAILRPGAVHGTHGIRANGGSSNACSTVAAPFRWPSRDRAGSIRRPSKTLPLLRRWHWRRRAIAS